MFLYLWWHTRAGILEDNRQISTFLARSDIDFAALGCEFDSVVQKIVPDMCRQLHISIPGNLGKLRVDIERFCRPDRLHTKDASANLLIHPKRLFFCDNGLIFQTGQLKDIAGHLGEFFGTLDNDIDIFIAVFYGQRIILQKSSIAADGGKRGLKFMRYVGDKVRVQRLCT